MKSLIQQVTGTSNAALGKAPQPTRGQALADSIWRDYDALDKMREEARESKRRAESAEIRDKLVQELAEQLSKKIDEDVMSEMRKLALLDTVRIKSMVPPPPNLDVHDRAEMRRQLEEAVEKSNGDPSKLSKMMGQIREFFR